MKAPYEIVNHRDFKMFYELKQIKMPLFLNSPLRGNSTNADTLDLNDKIEKIILETVISEI